MGDGVDRFWAIAAPLLLLPGVERSTMMGFPCLRLSGAFFACVHKDGGSIMVKLAADRVLMLIEQGEGEPFAPAGRVFREWLAVPLAQGARWPDRVTEAHAFAAKAV